jgi:hypothetical protein
MTFNQTFSENEEYQKRNSDANNSIDGHRVDEWIQDAKASEDPELRLAKWRNVGYCSTCVLVRRVIGYTSIDTRNLLDLGLFTPTSHE